MIRRKKKSIAEDGKDNSYGKRKLISWLSSQHVVDLQPLPGTFFVQRFIVVLYLLIYLFKTYFLVSVKESHPPPLSPPLHVQ